VATAAAEKAVLLSLNLGKDCIFSGAAKLTPATQAQLSRASSKFLSNAHPHH
jgi:hypothetical protein